MDDKSPVKPSWLPDLSSITRMRLGPGIIGRTSHVMLGLIFVAGLAFVFLRNDGLTIANLLWALIALTAAYLFGAFWYATKFPHASIMDGADFVRHAEVTQSARDAKIIDVTATPVENNNAPAAIRALDDR